MKTYKRSKTTVNMWIHKGHPDYAEINLAVLEGRYRLTSKDENTFEVFSWEEDEECLYVQLIQV